ncbi:MAG: hypothetical protein OEO79_04375 [Gemmatimonadota bacterium]|nr:hypothetical protein [Gemmatimonadota bacterium]
MRGSRRLARASVRSLSLLTIGLVSACGGKDPPTQVETPTISVSVSPTSGSVAQGSSLVIAVTVTGGGGFTGAATVSLEAAPSGVTGSAGNVQTSGGNTTADMTVAVGGSVAPGSYTLTIRATGTGVTAVTASFGLTVTATPSYALSATPSQLLLEQGASGTVNVSLSRTNYTEAVDLSLEGAPTGVTGSFSVDPVTGTASVLTVDVGGSVTPGGPYTLTIRGTSASLTDRTATVALTVTAPAVPDYLLAVTPSALTINQGASQDATVDITRSNFSGAVTLAAEGVPTDVSVAFAANPVAGNSTTMTVTVAGTVATGNYDFTVRGTATGLTDKTVSVALTVAIQSSYALALNPTTISIGQGTSGAVDVTLSRTNYTDAVDLSLEGAPAGVTGNFSVDPVAGTASVLTLDVGGSVTPGDYNLTVRGTSTSLADETAGLTLTVPTPAGFSLASITAVSVQQGSSGVRTVTIDRTGGFTGDVTVTVTDLAAGITASVDPVSTTGNSVDVTINVAGSVTPGAYTATVRGNASSLPESTQVLDIAVTSSSGFQVTLDFSACAASDRPVWVAYKDGAGDWTVGAAGNPDVYTFSASGPRVGIAAATEPAPGESNVLVYYAGIAELIAVVGPDLCDAPASGKTVTATVAGIGPSEFGALTLGSSTIFPVTGNGGWTFTNVPDGNLDLVGYKADLLNTTDRMTIIRDLNPPDATDIGTIDFGSGFVPDVATITVPAGAEFWEVEYGTTPAVVGTCYYAPLQSGPLTGNTFTARGAPAIQQQGGDFHLLSAASVTGGFWTVSEAFVTLANVSITAGPALPMPTITDVTGSAGYKRVLAEVTWPAGFNEVVWLSLSDGTGDHAVAVFATAAWVGGFDVALEVPDFTGLLNWDDAWAPAPASPADWSFSASGWSGTECTNGYREYASTQTGTVP